MADEPIPLDFSNVKGPGDVAVVLAQWEDTQRVSNAIASALGVSDEPDVHVLHQEIVGAIAFVVERYLSTGDPS